MIINSGVKDKLPFNNLDNVYVVADFDWTVSSPTSNTSWSLMGSGDYFPKSYLDKSEKLFNYYRPIEILEDVDRSYKLKMMEEWFTKSIDLFVEYQIEKEKFDLAVKKELIRFRSGAKEFIDFLHEKNIPFIIISAGLGDVIESFLKYNNSYYDNIYIISNRIVFKNGKAVGIGDKIIHSLNKNEISLPQEIKDKINNRNNVILLADQVEDLNMVDKNKHQSVITVGFNTLDISDDLLAKYYDIVCEDKDSYKDVKRILFGSD